MFYQRLLLLLLFFDQIFSAEPGCDLLSITFSSH